ncbi:O-antigen ligase family protein [Terriglobus roseus]|uniref:O-Antigen ligase n=1 Tax=Terriglobus roseus TaxID=392734 RepID=A0A1H4TXQ7_9BACT|nr:O-antigen ligase family protein [Terriglobus roseus]SEC60998.1 O-Antigen ligase [Terriglobus roseus]
MKALLITFVVVIAALLLLGAGGVARVLFPIGAILIGGLLLRKRPDLYMDALLWSWFLCAFLRRVMDYQAGWKEPSLVLIVPYLMAFVAPVLDFKQILSAPLKSTAAFVIAAMAICYGAIIGITQQSITTVVGALLQWGTPVAFAWWFTTAAPDMQAMVIRSIRRSFFWAILIMGVYGLYQYVVAPTWDVFWLEQLGGVADVTSMGTPEPYGLRVFSTMNSAGAFALVTAAGLLIVADSRHKLSPVVFSAGALALLLTLGRSGWMATVFGLILLATIAPKRVTSTIAVPLLFAMLFGSALAVGPAAEVVNDRISSFTHPSDDASGNDRTRGASSAMKMVSEHPQGYGLGVGVDLISNDGSFSLHDDGIAEGFLTLGLVGGFLYFGSLGWLLIRMLQRQGGGAILTLPAIISLAFLSQIPLGSSNLGVPGFFFWMFAAWAVHEKLPKDDRIDQSLDNKVVAKEGFRLDTSPSTV